MLTTEMCFTSTTNNVETWLGRCKILIEDTHTNAWANDIHYIWEISPSWGRFTFWASFPVSFFVLRPLLSPWFTDESFQDWKAFRLRRQLTKACRMREASALICRIFAANAECLFSVLCVLFCMHKSDICNQCTVDNNVFWQIICSLIWFSSP